MSRPWRAAPKAEDWRKAREDECMTVEEAAAVINVDPSTWRGWEAGKHTGPWVALAYFREHAGDEQPRAA